MATNVSKLITKQMEWNANMTEQSHLGRALIAKPVKLVEKMDQLFSASNYYSDNPMSSMMMGKAGREETIGGTAWEWDLKGANTRPLVVVENVGNLVCPSMFDLGERKRVVIISTTEGEDKPIKYPDMFLSSDLCIINKIDLLPYLNLDVEKLKAYAKQVNPNIEFLEVSATTGEGMQHWYSWLQNNLNS